MSAGETPSFTYDTVAYPTAIIPALTPERLQAAGMMHGWLGPDPATASVLEIGCGDGLNAIGIAALAPRSRATGFDLAESAIARGVRIARAAGIGNVDLHAADILTYPRDGAPFDYIVCHGVYAWVPEPVRTAILDLIGARLAPGGVAYVSYDCLPAAAAKAQLGAFLNARLGHIGGAARAAAAFELLAVLAANQRGESRLKVELDNFMRNLPRADPTQVFHDILAEHYAPVSLAGFASAAANAGLAVAGDADYQDHFAGDVTESARSLLAAMAGDMVACGSLLDMLRGSNMFRRTILHRAGAPPPPADQDALRTLRFETLGHREEVEEGGEAVVRYANGKGSWLIAGAPHETAIMEMLLDAAPREIALAEFEARAGAPDFAALIGALRKVCAYGLAAAHATPQPFVAMPGERPEIGALIRAMVAQGIPAITLRHLPLQAEDPGSRHFIDLCDGSRDRAALVRDMAARLGTPVELPAVEAAIERLRHVRVFIA